MSDWIGGICGEGNMQDDSVCKGGDRHWTAVATKRQRRADRIAGVTNAQLSRSLGAIALHNKYLSDNATDEIMEASKRLLEYDS